MPKVFISYSSRDREIAERLASDLRDAGISVWYAEWEIRIGDSIVEKINSGIVSSDYLVIVLSQASTSSRWVNEELAAAKTIEIERNGVFILPALVENCPIPPLIASKRYADFRGRYQNGLRDILSVLGRTSARVSEADRYRELEDAWFGSVREIEKALNFLTEATPGDDGRSLRLVHAMQTSELTRIREQIGDALDIYRALRPLEKSEALASRLDGGASFLAVLARRYDVQLQSLEWRFGKAETLSIGVLLAIGCAQAACGLTKESTWSFRKAIRFARTIKEDLGDALVGTTYQLARRICFLVFESNLRYDLVVGILAYEDREAEQQRCQKILRCFRDALEREVPWSLSVSPFDQVSYAEVMEASGFWREALYFLKMAGDALEGDRDHVKRKKKMDKIIRAMDSRKRLRIDAPIHQIPTLFCEFGQRVRYDELIQEINPDFWDKIVVNFDQDIPRDLERKLFPAET